ncbi:MAG TPA: hypothetical protein VIK96_02485 [Bacilli bacterium]
MLKLLLIFLSSFLIKKNPLYQEIISTSEEAIVDERGGYILYQEAGNLYLRHKSGFWHIQLPEASQYRTALKKGNYLFLFETNDAWEVREYDNSGKLIYSQVLITNPLKVTDIIYAEGVYVTGSIDSYQVDYLLEKRGEREGEDAIILRYDDDYHLSSFQIFGGKKDESFLKLISEGDKLFVVGRKDPESGGDFGNGGRFENSLFVARLSDNLALENFIILGSDQQPLEFTYHKDALYLALVDKLYKMDEELNIIAKKTLSKPYRAARIAEYNKCLYFGTGEVAIIDILDFSAESISSAYLKEDSEIKVFPDAIMIGEKQKYDLASFEDFIVSDKYTPEIESPKTVKSIFGEAELLEVVSEPFFNPQVHGDYERVYYFQTVHGLNFNVKRTERVDLRVNVTNNGIYPSGYRLQFTGYAELDGNSVLNNHFLETEGSHRLVLTDNAGNNTEINFTVSKSQIIFSETADTVWDFETQFGEPFFLELSLSGVGKRVIKGVVINGEEIKNLLYNPATGILTIPLEADAPGIKHYMLEKLLYMDNDKLLNLPIYRLFTANILRKAPSVNLNQVSTFSYEVDVSDSDSALRYLEVIATNGHDEHREIYPLGTGNFNISLAKGTYDFEINLLYDLGNKRTEAVPLFLGKLKGDSDMKIGEINIIRRHGSLEKFSLTLEKPLELSAQGDVLYRNSVSEPIYNLIVGGLAGAVSFSAVILFSKLKKRTKKSSA